MAAGETFAPAWEILVGGKPLPPEVRALISEVRVTSTTDGADHLVITAAAWDSIRRRFTLLDDAALAPGTLVVARGGYWPSLETFQRFRIMREEPNYPENGQPTVVIHGYSAEQRLVKYTAPRVFDGPIADSDIVVQLAEEHGLYYDDTTIDGTDPQGGVYSARIVEYKRKKRKPGRKRTTRNVVEQGRTKANGTSDWQFLQQLAVANGFEPPKIRYDDEFDRDVLYFRQGSLHNQDEVATFRWRPAAGQVGTCLSFQAQLSLADVPTHVDVVGWDSKEQRAIKVSVTIDEGKQEPVVTDLSELRPAALSGTQLLVSVLNASEAAAVDVRESVTVYTVQTDDDAVRWAERWIATRNTAYMQARAKTIGFERLWANQIHKFLGLAPHNEGLWAIESVAHVFDGNGYHCELDLSRVLDEAGPPIEVSP